MKNFGAEFENIIQAQHDAYRVQGRAKLEKVCQPIKVFGKPPHQRVIHLDNPFLDFTGSWTERGGRNLHIECKVTQEPRLAINSENGGVKTAQLAALQEWEQAGAAVGVLWFHAGRTRLVTINQMLAARAEGRQSVQWVKAYDLHQTGPLVFWDYLTALAALYS